MREAVGGAYLFYFVIGFLLIYIFFMSFIMNYASTYRAANYVVTQIENCQGQKECKKMDDINTEIKSKYHYVQPDGRNISICCISNGKNASVFRVELPVGFDVPMLGTINWIKVKAETKTIQNIVCENSEYSNRC